ncbi:hypothetical protein [Thiolapillus sp.]
MILSSFNILLREFLDPLNDFDHSTPEPMKLFEEMSDIGIPEDQFEAYIRNAFYTAPLTKRQKTYLRGVLAGLEGAGE